MWLLFGDVISSSVCLGWARLFYCGTLWAFHIIILQVNTGEDKGYGVIFKPIHDVDNKTWKKPIYAYDTDNPV